MADTKARSLRDEVKGAVPLTGGTGETFKWDKPGKRLEGRFCGLKEGSMGGQLVTIDDGKELIAASAPAMLASALENVQMGTWVIIRYIGEEKSKKDGRPYKAFEAVAVPSKT